MLCPTGLNICLLLRAVAIDMKGQLDIRRCEETASASMSHVWFTDCENLFSHLVSPSSKQVDNTRTAIDLSALKQVIWVHRNDSDEHVNGPKGDFSLLVFTSAMIVDCLTMITAPGRLSDTLSTGSFNVEFAKESLLVKERSRSWMAVQEE